MVTDALISWLRGELRLLPRVRQGRVKAVDTSGPVDIATLDTGHRCRVGIEVSVDDTVIWLSGPFPVVIAKPYSTP